MGQAWENRVWSATDALNPLLRNFLKASLEKKCSYLVDAKPSGATGCMVNMFAWKSDQPITSFIFHLANDTSVPNKRKLAETRRT